MCVLNYSIVTARIKVLNLRILLRVINHYSIIVNILRFGGQGPHQEVFNNLKHLINSSTM